MARNTYRKQYEFNGKKFQLTVRLDHIVEKRINGFRWHLITMKCDSDFSFSEEVEVSSESLKDAIARFEKNAKDFAKKKVEFTEDEQTLINQGFKKD